MTCELIKTEMEPIHSDVPLFPLMLISIKDLRLQVIIGVNESERLQTREVILNLEIEYDTSDAVRLDDIEYALDYKQVRDRVILAVQGTSFRLIESLAGHIVTALIDDPHIQYLKLTVDKPGALRMVESVSATTSWRRI